MFKVLKWIVKQPVGAVKFVARQAKNKTGRYALGIIGTTILASVGGEKVAPHAPEIVNTILDVAANPTVATMIDAAALALMFHRDAPLKAAQNGQPLTRTAPKRAPRAKKT